MGKSGLMRALVREGSAARQTRLEQDALKLLRAGRYEEARAKAVEARALEKEITKCN